MEYIERDIDNIIENWDRSKEKSLMILGARQIGKTKSIEHFLKKKQNIVDDKDLQKIDLSNVSESTIELIRSKRTFEGLSIIESIFANENKNVDAEMCNVVFIDEIQVLSNKVKKMSNAEIRDCIKYILGDSKYRVIFSGSLLGAKISEIESINEEIPQIQIEKMFPISFKEFIKKYEDLDNVFEKAKHSILCGCVEENFHIKMLNLFAEYSFVGGMPDSVLAYLKDKEVKKSFSAIKTLSNLYYLDIEKYCETAHVPFDKEDIFRIMYEGLKQNDKKEYVLKNFSTKEKQQFYRYVIDSDVGLLVPHIDDYNSREKMLDRPKCYFNDVGFLRNIIKEREWEHERRDGDELLRGYFDYFNGNYFANRPNNDGYIFEQIIAQDFKANKIEDAYFYENDKSGEQEIEFVFPSKNIAVEIKSGNIGKLASAKKMAVKNVVLLGSLLPYIQKCKDNIILVPIYFLCLFNPIQLVDKIIVDAEDDVLQLLRSGLLPRTKGFFVK